MLGLRPSTAPTAGAFANLAPADSANLLWDVLEHMPDAVTLSVAVRDNRGVATDMRLAFMNGLARAAQPDAGLAIGRLFSELWPMLITNGAFANCLDVLNTGHPAAGEFEWTDETTYQPAGYEYRATRIGDDLLLWVLRDSTERLRTGWALARSNADLAAVAHMIAHDLKTPLTAIMGNAEILGNGCGRPDEDLLRLAAIGRGAERMATLINGMLAYSQATHSTGEPAVLDPAAVAREVLTGLRACAGDARATVRVEPMPLVRMEPALLARLLRNLLLNALTYTRPQVSPQITISGNRWVDGPVAATGYGRPALVELAVADNGVGIEPALRQDVLQLFSHQLLGARLEPAVRGGAGIGLATCARIVERHRGRIWITDSPLGGAQVHVTLPAGG